MWFLRVSASVRMKTSTSRWWLLLVALALAGCAAGHRWRYATAEGQACGGRCMQAFHQCSAGCFGAASCVGDCNAASDYCFTACPGVSPVP